MNNYTKVIHVHLKYLVKLFVKHVMGKKRKLNFDFEINSLFSNGGREGAKQSCATCRGQGIQFITRQIGPGMIQRMQQVCKECNGEGEIINERDRCKTCHGKKTIDEKKKLEIIISPGSKHEQQVRFPGESDQAPNIEAGDVIIVLQQEPHAVFERSGDNLIMKHKINLVESLCGFQIVITHLDGRKIVVTHPPNDPIAPGRLKYSLTRKNWIGLFFF